MSDNIIKYKIREYNSTTEQWDNVYYPETSADQVIFGESSNVNTEITQLKSDVSGLNSDLAGYMAINDYTFNDNGTRKINLNRLPLSDLTASAGGNLATQTFVEEIANGISKTYVLDDVSSTSGGHNNELYISVSDNGTGAGHDYITLTGTQYGKLYSRGNSLPSANISNIPAAADLAVGDVILITNVGAADLWVSAIQVNNGVVTSITFNKLETQKYDLSAYVPNTRTISTSGAGISGGGALSSNQTIKLSSYLQLVHSAISTINTNNSEGCLYIEKNVNNELVVKPIRLFDYNSSGNNFGISLDESVNASNPTAFVQIPNASTSTKGIAKFTAGTNISISTSNGNVTINSTAIHVGDQAPTDTAALWLDTTTAA